MKKLFLIVTVLCACSCIQTHAPAPLHALDTPGPAQGATAHPTTSETPILMAGLEGSIAALEYSIQPRPDGRAFSSPNRRNNLRVTYWQDGFSLTPRVDTLEDWHIQYQVQGIFRDGQPQVCLDGSPSVDLCGDQLLQHFGHGLQIEYRNTVEGMRQNFLLSQRPEGIGPLKLRIQTSGSLVPVSDSKTDIMLIEPGSAAGQDQPKLWYKDLKVYDAQGDPVPAWLEASDAELDEASGNWIAGIQIVVADADAQYPLLIDPISTVESALLEVNQDSAYFGYSVSSAGDVNGDGYSDVIIGAPFYDDVFADEGAAFIFHGSPWGVDSTPAVVLTGKQAGARFGWSVSTACDVNGDGFSDIIIGADLYNQTQVDPGAAFVYYGSGTGVTLAGADTLLTNLGVTGFGHSVACAGDVNDDGYSDLIVGAIYYGGSQPQEGAAFVFMGSPAGISTIMSNLLEGGQGYTLFGVSVASAGDVNGDGFSDVIVGAPLYDLGQNDEGAAFIYHGGPGGLSDTAMTILQSDQDSAWFGIAVSSAGDVDGNGYSDVVVGASLFDNGEVDEGAAFLYSSYGSDTFPFPPNMLESNQTGARLGTSMACAGDMNGDGYSDVAVGVPFYDAGNGACFLYKGAAFGITGTVFTFIQRATPGSHFGQAIASAGDVNGDGLSDLLVGTPLFSNGDTNEGGGFVFSGYTSGISHLQGASVNDLQSGGKFGSVICSAGDVNGDGFGELLVTAPLRANGQQNEGIVYCYQGGIYGISIVYVWILEVNAADAAFGWSAAAAGDVNGDGFGDIVVSAIYYNAQGAVFVYYGSNAGFSPDTSFIAAPYPSFNNFGVSVSSAGDVNGDGYGDILAFSDTYENGEYVEGACFIYHGSPSGISTSPNATIEGNHPGGRLSVGSSVGDVNGDGYGDIVLGMPHYHRGEYNEGAAVIYYGSQCGINPTAGTFLESNLIDGSMGASVSAAGDVNGDGFDDFLVSLSQSGPNPKVVLFMGSQTGCNPNDTTSLQKNLPAFNFGKWLSAGDINGDGFSDVIVGTDSVVQWEAMFVYMGSPMGIDLLPTSIFGNYAQYRTPSEVGDVNGDGFTDLAYGNLNPSPPPNDIHSVSINYGNESDGIKTQVQQFRPNSTIHVGPGGITGTPGQASISMNAKSFLGRQDGRLKWELKTNGTAFSSAGGSITNSVASTASSANMHDMAGTGTTIIEDLSGLSTSHDYQWRSRVVYDPVTAITGQMHGPWFYEKSRSNAIPGHGFKTAPLKTLGYSVMGNSQPIQNGDTVPSDTDFTDFGSISGCGDSIVRLFKISNSGINPVALDDIDIFGAASPDFHVLVKPDSFLAPGDSTSFEIRFRSTVPGVRNAVVAFGPIGCSAGTISFAIQGRVSPPVLSVSGGSQSIQNGDSTPSINDLTDFGSISGCGDSLIRSFTISNSGIHHATLSAISISGTASQDFEVLVEPDSVLAPGDSTTFTIRFLPTALGLRNAMVSIERDSCSGAMAFAVQGLVTSPQVSVMGNAQPIQYGDSTPSIADFTDFGSLSDCADSLVRSFTVSNFGNNLATLPAIQISGPAAQDFEVLVAPDSVLAPGDSTTFTIRFLPTALGHRNAMISMESDGCISGALAFAVQGHLSTPPTPYLSVDYGTISTTLPYSRYQWYREGERIEGADSATLTPFLPGNYHVEVIGFDSCAGISAPVYFHPNVEFGQDNIFISHPNPVSADELNIQILDSLHVGEPFLVEIYDSFGGLRLSFYSDSPDGNDHFDLGSLTGGLYQVKVTLLSNGRTETHLFLKVN